MQAKPCWHGGREPISTLFDEIDEAIREIEATEGWRVQSYMRSLDASYSVFLGSHKELERYLHAMARPEVAITLWGDDENKLLRQYNLQVLRLLHNYLASVKSLVEHTRIVSRKLYSGTPFWREYDEKVKTTFTDRPLARFVQDFRNYILHKGLPATNTRFSLDREPDSSDFRMDSYVTLDVASLLKWDKWTHAALSYLRSSPKKLRLDEVVTNYTGTVREFYDWFGQRQREIHAEDFNVLARLQAKAKEVHERLRRARLR